MARPAILRASFRITLALLMAGGLTAPALALSAALLQAQGSKPAEKPAPPGTVIDRLVAIVNGQSITESEVIWHLALDPAGEIGGVTQDTLHRVLQQVIDLELLSQESRNLPKAEVKEEEITKYLSDLVSQFASETAFRARMSSVGLDGQTLRDRVKHRIEIMHFIDFRFRAFVLVTSEEVEQYYRSTFEPEARARGARVQPLEEVKDLIERDITDSKVAREMTTWFEDARRRAEIVLK